MTAKNADSSSEEGVGLGFALCSRYVNVALCDFGFVNLSAFEVEDQARDEKCWEELTESEWGR